MTASAIVLWIQASLLPLCYNLEEIPLPSGSYASPELLSNGIFGCLFKPTEPKVRSREAIIGVIKNDEFQILTRIPLALGISSRNWDHGNPSFFIALEEGEVREVDHRGKTVQSWHLEDAFVCPTLLPTKQGCVVQTIDQENTNSIWLLSDNRQKTLLASGTLTLLRQPCPPESIFLVQEDGQPEILEFTLSGEMILRVDLPAGVVFTAVLADQESLVGQDYRGRERASSTCLYSLKTGEIVPVSPKDWTCLQPQPSASGAVAYSRKLSDRQLGTQTLLVSKNGQTVELSDSIPPGGDRFRWTVDGNTLVFVTESGGGPKLRIFRGEDE